ncbi:MAG: extracellular solute-binding protein [Firmicutes bacterium]|nr:extracellular solute-binding protein [Bacillota bacterium]
MRKMKFICLVMVVAIALTMLTGCVKSKDTGSTASTQKETQEPTNEPVKLDKITFATWVFYTIPEVAEVLEKLFKEDTGVELEIVHFAKDNWEDKLNALFLSGDIADVVRLPDNIYTYVKQDFIVPLDDYIKQNPEFKKMVEANPAIVENFTIDGKIYAVGSKNECYFALWFRDDLLRDLNLSMPKTLDDFVDILRVFKKTDINRNGKTDDTIPLTTSSYIIRWDIISSCFGVKNGVYLKDGKYVDSTLTPEYREFMDFVKMLYKDELIDREVPTKGLGDARTTFFTGGAGSIFMWDDIYDTLKKGLNSNGYENCEPVPAPPFEGPHATGGLYYEGASTPRGITKQCKYPAETFTTFFNWYYLHENGIISTSRGVPGYSYKVVDGVMVPDNDKGGVGNRGQGFPPVNPFFEYPFKFDPITQGEYDSIKLISKWGKEHADDIKTIRPSMEMVDYYAIKDDYVSKLEELFYRYVVGEIDYDYFVNDYKNYKKEIDLDGIIENMNKKLK